MAREAGSAKFGKSRQSHKGWILWSWSLPDHQWRRSSFGLDSQRGRDECLEGYSHYTANEVWIDGISLGVPQASKSALTNQNQWFWDSGMLYVCSTKKPSSGHTVEAGDRGALIFVDNLSYIMLSGLEVKNANVEAVYLRNSNHITLKNLKIHDSAGEGVNTYAGGGNHIIEDSEVYNTGAAGWFGNGSGIHWLATNSPSIVQNNYIHDVGNVLGNNPLYGTGNHGIYDEGEGDIARYNYFFNLTGSNAIKINANDVSVYGNVFNTVPVGGVYLDAYSGVKIVNNTFYNTGTVTGFGGIQFVGAGIETGIAFENNIFYVSGDTFGYAVVVNKAAAGFASDYNDVYGAGIAWGEWAGGSYSTLANWRAAIGQDTHSIFADPLLANPGASQFWIEPGSPASGAGLNLGEPYNVELLTTTVWPDRVATESQARMWNIGAYLTPVASAAGLHTLRKRR